MGPAFGKPTADMAWGRGMKKIQDKRYKIKVQKIQVGAKASADS
jgi:hypothetical protein